MAVYFINFDGVPEFGDMSLPLDSADKPPIVEPPVENFENNLISLPDMNSIETPEALMPEVISDFSLAAQEIMDYGNQEEVIAQISYDLLIKGLDTKEVKQSFKEAIDDSKFAWLTEDMMSQIKNGEFSLKNLNPIKAFVLAYRIQFLDLEIEWKQNVAF